jgi:hypothetical protein
MSYIVTNKWLRAGYGEPLRAFFSSQSAIERIIDFGHAPIFADVDVFPCIVVVKRPADLDELADQQTQVVAFPREVLKVVQLDGYVRKYSHVVPQRRLGGAPWSLEDSDLDTLLSRMSESSVSLRDYAHIRPVVGIKTGFNDAFLIDTPTKIKLTQAHPDLATHIRPYLRGRDIKRWSPSWEGLWIILLKSSGDYGWPWKGLPVEQAEEVFQGVYRSLYDRMKSYETSLRNRTDKGHYWWELRSCAYYNVFEETNVFYQDLAFHSRFGVGLPGLVPEMTCFCLPSTDLWLLVVLNSPLMWSYMWRNVIHGKDEVLRLKTIYIEKLPIASPTDAIRAEVEPAVERLIAITRTNQEARRDTLDWLRTEFGVEAPGQKLEAFATLDEVAFVEEVRKRRPKAAGKLTPTALRALREGYSEQATPVRERQAEALTLERRLADLVNLAYGLTPEDVELLWRTAPPRMPVGRP